MTINIISKISPKNNGQFPVADDVDTLGGYQVREDITDRNTIPLLNRKEGMLVYSKFDDKYYTLSGGLSDGYWAEVVLGGNEESSRNIILIDEPTIYNVPAGENQLIVCNYVASSFDPTFSIIINLPEEPVIMQEIIIKTLFWVSVPNKYILIEGGSNYIDGNTTMFWETSTSVSLRIRWTGAHILLDNPGLTHYKWSVISKNIQYAVIPS